VQLLSFTPQMRYFDLPHTIILPVKTRFCLTSFVAKEIDQSRSFDMESLRHRPTFAAESRPTLPIVFEGNSKRRADPRNLLLPPTVRTCTRAFQTQAMVTRTNWPSRKSRRPGSNGQTIHVTKATGRLTTVTIRPVINTTPARQRGTEAFEHRNYYVCAPTLTLAHVSFFSRSS